MRPLTSKTVIIFFCNPVAVENMHEKKKDLMYIKDFGSAGIIIHEIRGLWGDREFRKAVEQKLKGSELERAGAMLIAQLAAEGGG